MSQLWYGTQCPHCRYSTSLRELTLNDMIRNRQVSSTAEPFLIFVCPRCTRCFEWNYGLRQPLGQFEPLSSTDPVWISVVAKCDSGDCGLLTELLAIRPKGTTQQQILDERPTWNGKGIYCDKGHPIVIPLESITL